MNSIFLVISHILTNEQLEEARNRFNITKFIKLTPELQNIWSKVDPKGELPEDYLDSIKRFIIDNINHDCKNYALIQGEYGVVFNLVNWCLNNGVTPIYATTKRVYNQEIEEDGSIKRIHSFKHVNFRYYK